MTAVTEVRDPPAVTIVVPSYGRPAALGRCLESLAALDYPASRLEVVVVDDGSPDPPAVRPAGQAGLDLKVIRQDNRGPAAARNHGASVAAGEILAFTDDDCRPRRDWLRHLVAALAPAPTALVGGRTMNALAGNLFAATSQDLVNFLYDTFFRDDVPPATALQPFVTSNNIAARREAFLGMGGFDESFRYSAGEDRELSERWVAEKGPLLLIDAAVVDHYHAMGAARFLRQHFLYGRGAMHLFRRRGRLGRSFTGLEPASFYWRMLRYPMRRDHWLRGALGSALVGIAQAASIAGIAVEAVDPAAPRDTGNVPRPAPSARGPSIN